MRGVLVVEQDKHTISVHVNGKKRTVKEIARKPTAAAQDENDAIIPQPAKVIDFKKEKEERTRLSGPFWDDGNRDQSPRIPFRRKKKSYKLNTNTRFPLIILMALLCAIVIGVSIGFILLTIFTRPADQVLPTEDTALEPLPTFHTETIHLPSLQVEVVQGGAFSDEIAGEETVHTMQERGFAAALSKRSNPFFMFIGVGMDGEQGNVLNDLYELEGIETYRKSYEINGAEIEGQAHSLFAWFEQLLNQYEKLVTVTTTSFKNSDEITAEQLGALERKLQSLEKESESFLQDLPQDVQSFIPLFSQTLHSALAEIKTNERASLWKAEQALLDFLMSYEQMNELLLNKEIS